jgi:hypothetical protein
MEQLEKKSKALTIHLIFFKPEYQYIQKIAAL